MQPRDLSAHTPYVPGRGVEEVARDLGIDPDELIKLSSNENPHGASPDAVAAIREHAEAISVYPKASHTDVTARLADRWGVSDEQVWLTAGADGSIDYLSRAMLDPEDSILVPEPGFAYYGMSARYHHGEVNHYGLSKADGFEQTAENVLSGYAGERIVYVTSPHNPSGSVMDLEEIRTLADATADRTLVVVDEAYGEFTEADSAVSLIGGEREDGPRDDGPHEEGPRGDGPRDDVAVLRTFSKAYGLAGLRVGYAVVPDAWADAYARVNTPFAASELACRAALAALEDDAHVEKSVETARWARRYLCDHLDAPTFSSAANFVLAEVGDAEAVAEAAQERGVIVRDCGSFGLPACIRISTGTRATTRQAVETLNDVLADLERGVHAE